MFWFYAFIISLTSIVSANSRKITCRSIILGLMPVLTYRFEISTPCGCILSSLTSTFPSTHHHHFLFCLFLQMWSIYWSMIVTESLTLYFSYLFCPSIINYQILLVTIHQFLTNLYFIFHIQYQGLNCFLLKPEILSQHKVRTAYVAP